MGSLGLNKGDGEIKKFIDPEEALARVNAGANLVLRDGRTFVKEVPAGDVVFFRNRVRKGIASGDVSAVLASGVQYQIGLIFNGLVKGYAGRPSS